MEEEEPLFSAIDDYESSIRFVDQPGQWVDSTPNDIKRQQQKAWDELFSSLNAEKNDY